MRKITQARLREVLDYCPETGVFTWRSRPVRSKYARTDKSWNSHYAGNVAGTDMDGYIQIMIDYVGHRAHRLAFLWMEGKMPEEVDHRDLDRANNSWGNLRPATRSQNFANKGIRSDNISGRKGVSWHDNLQKWRARICMHGKQRHLGCFDTLEEAAAAYAAAATKYHGEFARSD